MTITHNKKEFTKVSTDNGKYLYLIEPGYFLNKDLFKIYNKTNPNIEYDELLKWMEVQFAGSKEQIERSLNKSLELLLQRELISIDKTNWLNKKANIKKEIDLVKDHAFYPITQLDIIASKKCNFNCRHCYIDFDNKIDHEFNYEDWIDVCKKLMIYGLQTVVITGGEPLLLPGIERLIQFLANKNIKIMILTNGYLISRNFLEEIKDWKEKLTFQVSLDGSNSETHDYQRNKPNAFNTTVQNIKLLRNYDIPVALSMVLNKANIQDIYDGSMFKLAHELDVEILGIAPSIIQSGNARKEKVAELNVDDVKKVVDFIHNFDFDDKFPTVTISAPPALTPESTLKHSDVERPRCRRGVNSFAVRPNGDIATCSDFMEVHVEEYKYGNIINDDLDNILNKAIHIQHIIMQRYQEIKGVCSICNCLKNCGGSCRADAYAAYNDILAPYPLCQKMYESGNFPADKIDMKKIYKNI